MEKFIFKWLLLLPAFSASSALFAQSTYLSGEQTRYQHDGLTLSTSLGYLGGKAKENVYGDGRQLSQVDWKIKNAAIIKGQLNYDLLPWLSLNAQGWTTLAKGSSHMDDYDWFNPDSSSPSEHSVSPTRLNYANQYDLSVRGWVMNEPTFKFGPMAGFQQSRYSFTAHDGSYNYSGRNDDGTINPDLPRLQGTFNGPVIGYKQTFSAPYIGLAGFYTVGKFEFSGLVKYSNWVKAKDYDMHYLRATDFQSEAHNGRLWGAEITAGYNVTPVAQVYVEANYSRFTQARGDMVVRDYNAGEESVNSNAEGIENRTYSYMMGVKYVF
ncbi:omptin family outer membrane protease [Enterobacter asburiae]|uniref:omptin family outer membrane protease n=1 Tax=Scandinavium sp. UTDF21-P1B TaxID=3446379 RepID=UPI00347EE160